VKMPATTTIAPPTATFQETVSPKTATPMAEANTSWR